MLEALAPAARYTLRHKPDGAPFLNMPINTCVEKDGRVAARLGPDEWALYGAWRGDVEQALQGRFYSLIDLSHQYVSFRLSGAGVRDVVNGACTLDLRDTSFGPGRATRTLFGKADIVLMRRAEAYDIECLRSFAPYVEALIKASSWHFPPP